MDFLLSRFGSYCYGNRFVCASAASIKNNIIYQMVIFSGVLLAINVILLMLTENGLRNKEGKANYGYKTGDEVEDSVLSKYSTMDLTATVERLASNPDLQTLDASTRDTIKILRSLLNDQRFQKSYHFAQKVKTKNQGPEKKMCWHIR